MLEGIRRAAGRPIWAAVPFENLDPLLGKVLQIDLGPATCCARWSTHGGAAIALEQNSLFNAALKAAGFCRPGGHWPGRGCGSAPREHAATSLRSCASSWIANSGLTGCRFRRTRLPRSVADRDRAWSNRRPTVAIVVTEDAERGETVLERREDSSWLELYAFDSSRVSDGEIHAANLFCAVSNDAPFSSHLLLGFYVGDTRYGLFDRSLTIKTPNGRNAANWSISASSKRWSQERPASRFGLESSTTAWEKIGQGYRFPTRISFAK